MYTNDNMFTADNMFVAWLDRGTCLDIIHWQILSPYDIWIMSPSVNIVHLEQHWVHKEWDFFAHKVFYSIYTLTLAIFTMIVVRSANTEPESLVLVLLFPCMTNPGVRRPLYKAKVACYFTRLCCAYNLCQAAFPSECEWCCCGQVHDPDC